MFHYQLCRSPKFQYFDWRMKPGKQGGNWNKRRKNQKMMSENTKRKPMMCKFHSFMVSKVLDHHDSSYRPTWNHNKLLSSSAPVAERSNVLCHVSNPKNRISHVRLRLGEIRTWYWLNSLPWSNRKISFWVGVFLVNFKLVFFSNYAFAIEPTCQ